MSHQHNHQYSNDNLKIAFFLNLGFTILEIIGGVWTNSVAIIADALHDLGDSFSLGLAWFLSHYAEKGRDRHYSYGYRRYSLVGALVNTIVLIAGSIFILSETIPRLLSPEPTNSLGMVGFAIVGVIVNGVAAWRVKGERSLNAQVVNWHLLEDVLGWAALLIVSLVLLVTDWYILDPILSLLITGYVLFNVVRRLRDTVAIFLQSVPEEIDIGQLEADFQSIASVQSSHHTHIWSLDGEHHVLTTHLVVPDETSKEEILQIKREVITLTEQQEFEHVTIEIEYENEDCRMKHED